MTLNEALYILKDEIQPDGGLFNLGHYLAWSPGEKDICLDCRFEMDELEAMIVYIRHHNGQKDGAATDHM